MQRRSKNPLIDPTASKSLASSNNNPSPPSSLWDRCTEVFQRELAGIVSGENMPIGRWLKFFEDDDDGARFSVRACSDEEADESKEKDQTRKLKKRER